MSAAASAEDQISDWPAPDPSVRLMGVPFWAVTEEQVVGRVMAALAAGAGGWIVTPNLDILRQITGNPEARRLVRQADFLVADGMPLLWAARLQGSPLPQRVAGSNLIHSLSAAAARAGRSVYLLGGDPGTAEAAASELVSRHPGLVVAGHQCPPHGFENDPGWMDRLEQDISAARPDIVYVGLGFPKQEKLIESLRPRLPGAWWIGVGISFSFVCGRISRAPKWLQNIGLEWVHRLVQEPRRLFRRYVLTGLPFACRLLWAAWRGR